MNFDFNDLLRAFTENHVRYLIIGGYAVMEYAEPRYTKDLDLWVGADLENAQRVYKALEDFGAPLFGLKPEDFTEEGSFYRIGSPPLMVDLLFSLEGLVFDSAWDNRKESEDNGVVLLFISRDDLIASKIQSGRPQDLLDVEALRLPIRPVSDFQGREGTKDAIEPDNGLPDHDS